MPINKLLQIHCDSAVKFLSCLTPGEDEIANQQYIYRGQADASWRLEPSALRTSGQLTTRSLFGTQRPSPKEQAHFEALVLRRFLKACDLSGLVVPGYSRALQNRLDDILEKKMDYGWPDQMFDEPLAVAQHYGVPTRLLDWTRRSFVAAYFAASAALQLKQAPDAIAVWSLNTLKRRDWNRVSLVTLPGGTAVNLAAQSGLFTIHRGMSHFEAAMAGLEEESELFEVLEGIDQPAIIKVTMPFSECPKLLRLCAGYGVSAPVLFPGMEGARKYVVDWAYSEFNGPPEGA
ncbi:FRG domain-containing protein [Pseudomonas chlororaphis]|uniref:FRG domain-containing protein n=1 Tax=Pseudomonas chlororaphis TaxID=587753 RepID=UPI0039DF2EAC